MLYKDFPTEGDTLVWLTSVNRIKKNFGRLRSLIVPQKEKAERWVITVQDENAFEKLQGILKKEQIYPAVTSKRLLMVTVQLSDKKMQTLRKQLSSASIGRDIRATPV
jgi:hypothetical protein